MHPGRASLSPAELDPWPDWAIPIRPFHRYSGVEQFSGEGCSTETSHDSFESGAFLFGRRLGRGAELTLPGGTEVASETPRRPLPAHRQITGGVHSPPNPTVK